MTSAKPKVKLTKAQEKAVTTTDRDICVAAGAGSGKTRVLVERFVHLVVNCRTPLERILTVTFTEKAAAEMKDRVGKAFLKRNRDDLRQAVEFAYISTFHAFCARLLREHALEAGVDPSFEVLDEYEASSLLEEAAEAVLTQWKQDNEFHFNKLVHDLMIRLDQDGSFQLLSHLTNLYDHLRARDTRFDSLTRDDAEFADLYQQTLDAILRSIEDLKGALASSLSQTAQSHIPEVIENLSWVTDLKRRSPAFEDLQHLNEVSIDLRKGGKAKECLRTLRDDHLTMFRLLITDSLAKPVHEALVAFLKDLEITYTEIKDEVGACDFADLELRTKRLLEREDVLSHLQDHFDHILIDEFQDTNPVQIAIVEALRRPQRLFTVGDEKQSIYGFRDADLEVFREHRAMIEAAGGERCPLVENFRSRDEILQFVNHIFFHLWSRASNEEGVIFEELICGLKKKILKKSLPSLECHWLRGLSKGEGREAEANILAHRIRNLVEEQELTVTVPGMPEDPPGSRTLSYRDIAVLFRSTSDLKTYERALADWEVPYYVVSGRGFFNAREVIDIINFLQVLNDPHDDVALAAVLRSPFVNLSDEGLFWLARRKPPSDDSPWKGRLWYALSNGEPDDADLPEHDRPRLVVARDLFERAFDLRDRSSLKGLLEDVLGSTGFAEQLLLQFNGKRKYANVKKVVQLAGVFGGRGALGLQGFLRVLKEFRLKEVRESEAIIDSAEDDAVKLMTIHKAKGLEFPLVVLPDLDRSWKFALPEVAADRNGQLGFSLRNPNTNSKEKTLTYERLSEGQENREREEERRLFYVALTRAREHLILSTVHSKSDNVLQRLLSGNRDAKSFFDLLLAAFGESLLEDGIIDYGLTSTYALTVTNHKTPEEAGRKTGKRPIRLFQSHRSQVEALKPIKKTIPPDARNIVEETTTRIKSPLQAADPTRRVVSVSELLQFSLCPRRYATRYILGIQKDGFDSRPLAVSERLQPEETLDDAESLAFPLRDDEVDPLHLGILAHRVFELYHYRPGYKGLKKLIAQEIAAMPQGLDSLDTRAELARMVQGWYESPLGELHIAALRQWREQPFLVKLNGLLVRGQMDLLFETQDGRLVCADFKASHIESEEDIERKLAFYKFQLALYTLAAETILGRRPDHLVAHFLMRSVSREIGTDQSLLDAASFKIQEYHKAMMGGIWQSIADHQCSWCRA